MGNRLAMILAVARAAALVLASIVVTSLATGWLYLLRGSVADWPGLRVHDVLPLDELPNHDSVPLVIYVAAFGVAGVSLGLTARALRLDRLTAAVSLAACVGLWLFAVDALSLFIVRQTAVGQAVRAAAGLQPVYLAAALCAAGGALLGRKSRAERDGHTLLAWMVAGGGLIDLVSAIFPGAGPPLGIVERLGPGAVVPAAHALLVPAGVLLLITSRGLARRNRRAWRLAIVLLGMSAVLHLIRGPDYPAAIVTGLVAVALIARRQDFPFQGDPAAEPPALLRLGGTLLLAVAYGFTALWAYRTVSDLPFSPLPALQDTARALVGMAPRGSQYLPGDFSRWFPISVASIAAIGVIWAADVWIRPWRQRLLPDTAARERAGRIVRQWGSDTLAPFALRADKEWFFTGQTLVAYRVVRGIAVVSGDPVGPPGEAGAAVDEFLAYAHSRGWRTILLGASSRFLCQYRDRGLRPVYHGDEAVIDVASFSLEGRQMRVARQAVHRVIRHGYQAQVTMAGDVSASLRAELAGVERAWLRGARKGFTMELDDLFRLGGTDALFVIGRDAQGRVTGFAHLAVCQPSRSLSLSSMPRLADTPNGLDAWLVVTAVSWARANGFAAISLNFSPFAGLLGADVLQSPAQRFERRMLFRLKGVLALQLDNLLTFNRQFAPNWVPRYVVIERRADLPSAVVAAMAAEGYLPHAAWIRGNGWSSLPGSLQRSEPLEDATPAAEPGTAEPAATRPHSTDPAATTATAATTEPHSTDPAATERAATGTGSSAARNEPPEPGARRPHPAARPRRRVRSLPGQRGRR